MADILLDFLIGAPRCKSRCIIPGGPRQNRISCNCWALYLRILRRWLEHGEAVPYDKRLET